MTNKLESAEFKALILSQNKGIVDAYVNDNGGFNVICKTAKTAMKIKFDLSLSGLKNVKILEPNPFNQHYHVSALA